LTIWCVDDRTGRNRLRELLRWSGLVPYFQHCAIRSNEAQHGARIQTADEDALIASPDWLHNHRVGVRIATDFLYAMEQRQKVIQSYPLRGLLQFGLVWSGCAVHMPDRSRYIPETLALIGSSMNMKLCVQA